MSCDLKVGRESCVDTRQNTSLFSLLYQDAPVLSHVASSATIEKGTLRPPKGRGKGRPMGGHPLCRGSILVECASPLFTGVDVAIFCGQSNPQPDIWNSFSLGGEVCLADCRRPLAFIDFSSHIVPGGHLSFRKRSPAALLFQPHFCTGSVSRIERHRTYQRQQDLFSKKNERKQNCTCPPWARCKTTISECLEHPSLCPQQE